jgi:hypothetical protein
MVPEVEVFCHFDNMVLLLLVLLSLINGILINNLPSAYPFAEIIKDFDFDQGLVMESFLVTDYFNCN